MSTQKKSVQSALDDVVQYFASLADFCERLLSNLELNWLDHLAKFHVSKGYGRGDPYGQEVIDIYTSTDDLTTSYDAKAENAVILFSGDLDLSNGPGEDADVVVYRGDVDYLSGTYDIIVPPNVSASVFTSNTYHGFDTLSMGVVVHIINGTVDGVRKLFPLKDLS